MRNIQFPKIDLVEVFSWNYASVKQFYFSLSFSAGFLYLILFHEVWLLVECAFRFYHNASTTKAILFTIWYTSGSYKLSFSALRSIFWA